MKNDNHRRCDKTFSVTVSITVVVSDSEVKQHCSVVIDVRLWASVDQCSAA